MSQQSLVIALFALAAFGLPIWAMQNNQYSGGNTHACIGECYQAWREETGGVLEIAAAQAAAKAEASPVELGQAAYAGCVACHGAGGEGGVGPALAGTAADAVSSALKQYRDGQTRGAQSSLMWSQARELSDTDISNLSAFIESL